MKNKKIVHLYKKFFKKRFTSKTKLSFITNLYTFVFLLVTQYRNECFKTAWIKYDIKKINLQKLITLLPQTNLSDMHIVPIVNVLITFFDIDHDKPLFNEIVNYYCKIYSIHCRTKPLNYFYTKKYNIKDNTQSVANYAEIIDLIGKMNNEIKSLLTKNYADLIQFSKNVFLRIKCYE